MAELTIAAWLTIAVIGGVFVALATSRLQPDVILLSASTALLLGGVLDVKQVLSGYSNAGVVTVGVLYVVVAGLRDTGAVSSFAQHWLGRPKTVAAAQLRMMLPVAGASMFMNNTPLVAAMVPAVTEWARKLGLPVSALLLPLSYAAILGGLCTLIGTSTNLVVAGLLQSEVAAGRATQGLGFFTLMPIGLAAIAIGMLWITVASPRLLPARGSAVRDTDDPRAYTVEMLVMAGGAVDGRSIEDAGLRHLPGCYLGEVDRNGEILAAIGPGFRLQGGDRLVFVGLVETVIDLQKIAGLLPATDQTFKLDGPRAGRILIEAVVSDSSPLLGRSIREGHFRTRYNAVVIAVARGGERLHQRLGDIILEQGDTLLLEARPAFLEQQRNSRDFYLVSGVPDSHPLRHERAGIALAILALMVIAATLFEQLEYFRALNFGVLHAVLPAALLMIATGCCSVDSARRNVDWAVLVVIGSAIALGRAVEVTGLASGAASFLIGDATSASPLLALAVVYGVTMLATELLSNNAAAVLMFPIAMATAHSLGLDPMPFVVATTIAASCGFATPLGYQTHMMVYGPGGYRFGDFLRMGLPLNVLVGVVTVAVTPLLMPFKP